MRLLVKTLLRTVVFSVIVSTAGVGWAAPGQADDLARAGTPSASYTSPWESAAALNDGLRA
ncbi:hypothetical protein [Actinoplanes sp. ATCC 53533]|uniref:hypothetical protein n=1 Tax=Actinoplanes sp. ATCC 53533 TaxID=1288362 RepID=UPI000F796196|nr:hypothetical protein [Actinoplanes sp. ATCC 53533]